VLLVYRASRPHVATLGQIPGSADQFGDIERHPENAVPAGVAILRPESGLFFANADRIRAAIRGAAAGPAVRMVILDLGTVAAMDLTAAKMLDEVHEELAGRDIALVIAHDVGQVRDILRVDRNEIPVYPSILAAVAAAQERPDVTTPDEPTR